MQVVPVFLMSWLLLFVCTYAIPVGAEDFDPNNYYGSADPSGGAQNPNQDTIDQYNALRNNAVGDTDGSNGGSDTVYDYSAGDGTQPATSGDDSGMLAPADGVSGNSSSRNLSGDSSSRDLSGNSSSGDKRLLANPLKSRSIEEFILKIIDVLLVFALPIIVLYIMYAGYLFVTAQGDSGQISTARSALLWAVVGGVIVLGARVIVAVIQGTIQGF